MRFRTESVFLERIERYEDFLRRIGNRAGMPTMDYAGDAIVRAEQRKTLDTIAALVLTALKKIA
jgi:hypothetical protein